MASTDHNVIDISSSPEPPSPSMSHARPKLKSNQKLRLLRTVPLPVIEVSDSDSDDAFPFFIHRKNFARNAVVGPSSKSAALQPKIGASASFDNLPNAPARRSKPSTARPSPLFLSSDEENQPPPSPSLKASSPVGQRFSPFEVADMEGVQPAEPEPEVDPVSKYVARVLEIIPDVEPDHLIDLVTTCLPAYGDQVVQHVLHSLFEDPTYPKVDKKGKGKRKQVDDDPESDGIPSKKTKIDYGNKDRPYTGGVHYADLALEQLQVNFPYIPKAYLRTTMSTFGGFYAPTHSFLEDQEKQNQELLDLNQTAQLPYTRKVTPFQLGKKGKKREIQDPEFEREHAWVLARKDQQIAEKVNEEEYEDCGDGIECGCCFSEYPFDKMIQCPEAHLFCNTCMLSYAETLLGEHNTNIKCMHQSGCTVPISRSELQRFLPNNLMDLWERLTQRKEVHAAGLDGWEECPFCEWGCVIENAEEKLFKCQNDGCGVVSCRGCKKVDHLPKSCKEVEDDKHLDGRHAIEEAMTRALMRNCPKCKKAFIKEFGCNKMTCPECGTMSCYVCRQAVTGYEHFSNPGQPGPSNRCVLHDPVEQRHADEVKAAAERALREYKEEHPDVDETAIKVDLPPAPPVHPAPPAAVPGFPFGIPPIPPIAGYGLGVANPRLHGIPDQLQLLGQRVRHHPELAYHYQGQLRDLRQNMARMRDGANRHVLPPAGYALPGVNMFVNAPHVLHNALAPPPAQNYAPPVPFIPPPAAHYVHNHAPQAVPHIPMAMGPLPVRRNPPRNRPAARRR